MGLLRKKSVKNGIKIYQESIIIEYGHEKRFYKILKIRFLNDFYTKCIPKNISKIKQLNNQQFNNMSSYIKFLSRNKLYTIIEAIGLAVSLAFVIIIGSYAWQQYSITRESPDRKNIYCFGMPSYLGLTYAFADEVTDRVPEVEMAARYCIEANPPSVLFNNEEIEAKMTAVSKSFFTMFPYLKFVEGGPDGIEAPGNVIVSESFARKHDVKVGQTLDFIINIYVVIGIIEDFRNTVFTPTDVIVNEHDILNKSAWDVPYDRYGSTITFVKFAENADPKAIYDKVEQVCKAIYPDMYGQAFFERLDMTRFDYLFFKDFGRPNDQLKRGDLKTLKLLALVGLLLLLSAVFNYINLSFALTGKRAKEMATRRLLGAQKSEIMWKYVAESLVFTAVCFALGLLLAYAFAPSMNALLNDPAIPITIQMKPLYLLAYLAVIVVVGVLNGIIPAWFASRVEPMDVVNGTFKRNTKMVFNKVFIVIQNALAVFLITMAIVMEAQYRTSMNRPKNCNTQDKYYLAVFASEPQSDLHQGLEQLPCVKRIGRSRGVPGFMMGGQYSLTRDGQNILYRHLMMDTVAFQMFDFEILKDYQTPLYNTVWFGERAFAATGLTDEDHEIDVLRERTTNCDQVAGVIRDFPVTTSNVGDEDYQIISIMKAEDIKYGGFVMEIIGDHTDARKAIQEVVDEWRDGELPQYVADGFIDDFYRDALKPAKNNMRLLEIFMLLAVLISLLGLIAMSTYYAGENAKSIAVRKVFGGTVESETWRTVREYMVLVAVACVIAVPIAVWAAQRYLEGFIVKLENYGWIFVVAVVISLVMAFLSVLWQTLKAARTNPAEALKKE